MSNDSDNDSDDFGPMPAEEEAERFEPAKKKARTLDFESLYLDNLPNSDFYEHSYMHRDIVSHVVVSKPTEFIITGSVDGHVKFWKKMTETVEFVKHYQAHLNAINAMVVSPDGKLLVTTSVDKMIKFFEISGFDMSNMISVSYVPTAATWLAGPHTICDRVAVADSNSGSIRIYKSNSASSEHIQEIKIHMSPVKCIALNYSKQTVISTDGKGMIEYWDINSFNLPGKDKISFSMKSETDLYDLAKAKTSAYCLTISPSGKQFAILSKDKQIRLFDFKKGKLVRRYDESVSAYSAGSSHIGTLDNLELGRRQAMERELEASPESLSLSSLQYDESGNFLVYGSLRGIKLLNIVTNKISRVVGAGESGERFLGVALYQGVPQVDQQMLLSRSGEGMTKTVDQMNATPSTDPTIFCTSFKKRRFYCFSKREPNEAVEARDKLNEMPTEEEKSSSSSTVTKSLSTEAIIHTTLGDITIKLFAAECPKTVENFTTHCRNKYYNNLIFHRVIKGFMLQTGDPLGNGTGGESVWGGEFEDEFVRTLRHDRPYTVSMANAGPNTNGSQFFITTVPTPWLDNKHTVFGRVTKGFEVITKIEDLKCNKLDKPYDEVKILSAEAL